MTGMRDELLTRIWRGVDPYEGVTTDRTDFQGWNSTHPWLTETIEEGMPSVIVEVGVWKGTSVITMAEKIRDMGIDAVVVAVDTWLGGFEFWINAFYRDLRFERGYPTLAQTFLSNVVAKDLQDYVIPLPMDSLSASRLLEFHRVRPEIIHIDGCHEYGSVALDIQHYWPLVAPGGTLIGDDYRESGPWPGVRKAFDEYFAAGHRADKFENGGGKCRVRKGYGIP